MNDRYDDLMLGLYGGWVPDWIPSRNRELFRRESLRRRCDLGQALLASYRCSLLCGRAMFSDEFVERVFSAWPRTRHEAENVITGLYLAMREVLQRCEASLAVQELLDYEALAVVDLRVRPSLALPWANDLPSAEWEGVEVYRFDHAVTQMHARMTLYAGSSAPARFVRELSTQTQTTLVSRRRMPNGWALADVTELLTAEHGDAAP